MNQILKEEDELLNFHRKEIDDTVDLVKKEMVLIHEVDKPGSDVDDYIQQLDSILIHKLEMINSLRGWLKTFKNSIWEEERLS